LVLSWINNCLSRQIHATVLYIYTAKGVWDDLKQRYSQGNGTRVHHLKQAIASFKQENLTICDYFTSLKGLWDELLNYRPIPGCTCGAKCICGLSRILLEYQHYDYVHSFLIGLNDSFAAVRGQILLMEPLPGINKVFSLVQNHETQKGAGILPLPIGLPTVDNIALISRMNNEVNAFPYSNTASHALLSRFDNRFDNNKQYQYQYPRKDKPICSHCGLKGHVMEKCYKLHGYPPGFQKKSKSIAVANQVSSSSSALLETTDSSQNFSSLAMQCQQLLNMLNAQAQQVSPSPSPHQAATLVTVTQPTSHSHTIPNMAGINHVCLSSFNKPDLSHSVFSSCLPDTSHVLSSD
jgi:hypothetical protein